MSIPAGKINRVLEHPGDMLLHEFMVPYGLSANRLAKLMGVPANRVSRLVRGDTDMTADTALRLEKVLGMPAHFWMKLQTSYDLSKLEQEAEETYRSLKSYEAVR